MTYLLALLPWFLVGCFLSTLYFQRKLIHRWRLCARRERALLEIVSGLGEKIVAGSQQEALDHYGRGLVGLWDELHNQERHNKDRWPRVPYPGDEWKDFEPAPLLDEASFDGPS